MIRVRSKSGKTITVTEPLEFVEILDKAGDVVMMLRMNTEPRESVQVVYPGMDAETELYSRLYKVKWSNHVHIPFPPPEPVTVHAP